MPRATRRWTGAAPDLWASAAIYSTCQILEQTIEAVGTIDDAKIIDHIKNNRFETVIGPMEFDENNNTAFRRVGRPFIVLITRACLLRQGHFRVTLSREITGNDSVTTDRLRRFHGPLLLAGSPS